MESNHDSEDASGEAETEIGNSYDASRPFIINRTKLEKTTIEVRDENRTSRRVFRWKIPRTSPKVTTIPKTSEGKWKTIYDDGVIKIKLSLLNQQYYVYIDDEYRRIADHGFLMKLGLVCLETAEAFRVEIHKSRAVKGKLYTQATYVLKPLGKQLKAFKAKLDGDLSIASGKKIQREFNVESRTKPSSDLANNRYLMPNGLLNTNLTPLRVCNDSIEQAIRNAINWLKDPVNKLPSGNCSSLARFTEMYDETLVDTIRQRGLIVTMRVPVSKDSVVFLCSKGTQGEKPVVPACGSADQDQQTSGSPPFSHEMTSTK